MDKAHYNDNDQLVQEILEKQITFMNKSMHFLGLLNTFAASRKEELIANDNEFLAKIIPEIRRIFIDPETGNWSHNGNNGSVLRVLLAVMIIQLQSSIEGMITGKPMKLGSFAKSMIYLLNHKA